MIANKEDPIYYKDKIAKLIKQAQENGLQVYMPKDEKYICFKNTKTEEIASSYLPWLFEEVEECLK